MARGLAEEEGVDVDFRVGAAEEVPHPGGSFEAVTANQCWFYFDAERAMAEARRVLVPGGVLATSHFSYLAGEDDIARRSEELVLKFNPQWASSAWDGRVPSFPAWARERLYVRGMFYYDEPIPFTRESWRGRMRACRGVGAELAQQEVAAFDAELERLLRASEGDGFTILHRIDAHVFQFKEDR